MISGRDREASLTVYTVVYESLRQRIAALMEIKITKTQSGHPVIPVGFTHHLFLHVVDLSWLLPSGRASSLALF